MPRLQTVPFRTLKELSLGCHTGHLERNNKPVSKTSKGKHEKTGPRSKHSKCVCVCVGVYYIICIYIYIHIYTYIYMHIYKHIYIYTYIYIYMYMYIYTSMYVCVLPKNSRSLLMSFNKVAAPRSLCPVVVGLAIQLGWSHW